VFAKNLRELVNQYLIESNERKTSISEFNSSACLPVPQHTEPVSRIRALPYEKPIFRRTATNCHQGINAITFLTRSHSSSLATGLTIQSWIPSSLALLAVSEDAEPVIMITFPLKLSSLQEGQLLTSTVMNADDDGERQSFPPSWFSLRFCRRQDAS